MKAALEITGTFTVEPLEESLRFWLNRVGSLALGVRFGGYNQVFQELVRPPDPGCLARIVLIRPDDWGRFSEDGGKDLIEETATELIAALKAQSSGPPITVVFCPGTVDHGSLERRVGDALLDSSLVRVISSAWVIERYPVTRLHDPESDREGHIPYQPEFFSSFQLWPRSLHGSVYENSSRRPRCWSSMRTIRCGKVPWVNWGSMESRFRSLILPCSDRLWHRKPHTSQAGPENYSDRSYRSRRPASASPRQNRFH